MADLVLSGFLRVMTHPNIFRESTPLPQAMEFARDFKTRRLGCIAAVGKRVVGYD